MRCKLCESESKLCNSHIIPEFIYKDLYDFKHTFSVFSTLEKPTKKLEQKGIREYLFCGDCETQLSKYEDYAKRVIMGGVEITVTKDPGVIKIEGIDYKKFKLFLMSIIYRAGIASHDMFSRVNLADHEHTLKKMIKNESPGKSSDYACLMFGLSGEKELTGKIIDQPTRLRLDGMICYRFIFASLVWVFFVSSHRPNKMILEHVLNENGRIIIWIKPFMDLEHIKKFAIDLKNKGQLTV